MKPVGRTFVALARLAALAGLAAAGTWSFRVAAADQKARLVTVQGLEQAIAWSPRQSLNYVRLSALLSDADPKRAAELLQSAVVLNYLDSRSWIDLALRRELSGNLLSAERDLLRAAEVDRQYLPRWSLANYYFRHSDNARFWPWAQRAATMVYDDPRPLFRLCDEVDGNQNLIERLALRNPDLRTGYLNYVLAKNRSELIPAVAHRILTDGRESDVPALLAACDRLLELPMVDQALQLWNGLAKARLISYSPLSLADGGAITNGDFASELTSHGFDWHAPDVGGVSVVREDSAGGIRLIFTGSQPEACSPLSQFIAVQGNTHYELEYRYNTSGIANGAGLTWNVDYADVKGAPTTLAAIPSNEMGNPRVFSFGTPAGCHLMRLMLAYRRAPGTTRIEGRMVLRQVRLRRAR